MRKTFLLSAILLTVSIFAHSQLSILKTIGKNSKQNKLGYGLVGNYDIPLNEVGNQSVMIELLDTAFFPGKEIDDVGNEIARGYISVKLGDRNFFLVKNLKQVFL
jgi:hypothetical protein